MVNLREFGQPFENEGKPRYPGEIVQTRQPKDAEEMRYQDGS
jgi:hypothetical protein